MMKTMVMYPIYRREVKSRKRITGKGMKQTLVKKKPCPFIQEPYDDCLCANMLSQNIEAAIYYCGGNFKKCEIYKRWS